MTQQERSGERSLGELFSELTRETSTLVRQEVELAKTELSQKATAAGKDVGILGAGGAVAYAGFLALIAGVIAALDIFLPLWLAAIIVGLVVIGIGYMLVQRGRDGLKRADLMPRQTIATLKEDTEWAKDQTR
jgi:uncharacterized membrane protein